MILILAAGEEKSTKDKATTKEKAAGKIYILVVSREAYSQFFLF